MFDVGSVAFYFSASTSHAALNTQRRQTKFGIQRLIQKIDDDTAVIRIRLRCLHDSLSNEITDLVLLHSCSLHACGE